MKENSASACGDLVDLDLGHVSGERQRPSGGGNVFGDREAALTEAVPLRVEGMEMNKAGPDRSAVYGDIGHAADDHKGITPPRLAPPR